MAHFFRRKNGTSSDEKNAGAPEERETAVADVGEEGVVDEAEDDLHRGMKPRQLSELPVLFADI